MNDSHSSKSSDSDGYVTVSVARDVLPGKKEEYEQWVTGITAASALFPGHMGVNVLRPNDDSRRYIIIYRFDCHDNAETWKNSQQRNDWMLKLEGLVEGDTQIRTSTGLEAWFDLPELPASAKPIRWRHALVLTVVVFCLVVLLNILLHFLIGDSSLYVRTFVIVSLQVLLMTYVVMPRVTHYLKGWLYR